MYTGSVHRLQRIKYKKRRNLEFQDTVVKETGLEAFSHS
jgi:hypothetical protein